MKRFAFAALMLLTTHAFAADEAKAPPTAPVALTADEMNIVSAAMNKVSANCASDPESCVIGMHNRDIQTKLIAAFKTLQPAAPAKK